MVKSTTIVVKNYDTEALGCCGMAMTLIVLIMTLMVLTMTLIVLTIANNRKMTLF